MLAGTTKSGEFLLEQTKFTANMPSLMATSTFALWEVHKNMLEFSPFISSLK